MNKKVIVSYDNGKFRVSTTSDNTPMCYREFLDLHYEMAALIARHNKEANNEVPENIQLTDLDEKVMAVKQEALSLAQTHGVKVADVMLNRICKANIPIQGDLLNIITCVATAAFNHGWYSSYENYELIKKAEQ